MVSVTAPASTVKDPLITAAGLRAELEETKAKIEKWASDTADRVKRSQVDYEDAMERHAAEVMALRKAQAEASARHNQNARIARQQEEHIQFMRKRIEDLRLTETDIMPKKVQILETTGASLMHELTTKEEGLKKRLVMQEEELSTLTRGVLLYRHLGLDFEGTQEDEDGNSRCLRLTFRQVSRVDPGRPFTVGVRVDDEGVYEVPECSPPLPPGELEVMARDLNQTNDFSAFVRGVRRRFVSIAWEGGGHDNREGK
ncbi:unnamed protein product [Discosporangium mesarthrocarpum]